MALTCGFYNSVDGDRKYDATQFASLFDGVITDGVVAAVGDFFATTPGGGMVVNVGSGRAWFNRTWTYNDAKIPLTLDGSDLLYDRIDAVVLEIDTGVAVRDNSIKVVKGIPAQEPEKPTLTNEGDIHQYALAYVRVKASSVEIGSGDITINVGQVDCPFVTSIIETPELEVLFAQWDAQFKEWFENVQSQLEGDVAANLQRQIDANKEAIKNVKTDDTLSVGDLLYTTRNDPDDRFLLCNGKEYNREDYPLIEKNYPFDITTGNIRSLAFYSGKEPYNNSMEFQKVGDYLACVVSFLNSSTNYCQIDLSYIRIDEFDSSTTSQDIKKITDIYSLNATFELTKFCYINGLYVILGKKSTNPGTRCCILYASSIEGPWAMVDIYDMDEVYDIIHSSETNNYYLFGKKGNPSDITYGVLGSSSKINTGWIFRNVVRAAADGYKTALLSGIVKDGVLYAVGCKQQSSTKSYAIVAIINDPNSTGSNIDIREITVNLSIDCSANVIKYINNEFVIGGIINGNAYVWATPDINTISVSTPKLGLANGKMNTNHSSYLGVLDVVYDEKLQKYFYAITLGQTSGSGYNAIVASSDYEIKPGATVKTRTLAELANSFNYAKSTILYGDYLHVGVKYSGIVYDRFVNLRLFKIPSISISSGYVYIKAKENIII